MTDNNHPITPPPELVKQWVNEWLEDGPEDGELGISKHIATQAANWGADMELEACCEWLSDGWGLPAASDNLCAARRPKPPSRKDQALEAVSRLCASVVHDDLKNDAAIVRRALQALDD